MEEIYIKDNFITLNQLLKLSGLFNSGGEVKNFIVTEGVYVNDEIEYRRGKKLYQNDLVALKSGEKFIVKRNSST